jgi:hypothetical protein
MAVRFGADDMSTHATTKAAWYVSFMRQPKTGKVICGDDAATLISTLPDRSVNLCRRMP